MGRDLLSPPIASVREAARKVAEMISAAAPEDAIDLINAAREELHRVSPFRNEPVDFVRWVPADEVEANAYNPNVVAPPEMRLLELSIAADGYTQPIVSFPRSDGRREVVDGFHRNRIGKESPTIRKRVRGHLPVVDIKAERTDEGARRASTIRHNRARGRHGVQAMSEIVMDLVRRRWSDEKIATELGMDADEVIRLKQITGLADLFRDREFSEAWEAV